MNNYSYTQSNPMSISWNFPQPMQVQVTTQLNANHNYQAIAKDFIEKYATANTLGVACLGHYYFNDAKISLHVHHSSSNQLHEMLGHSNFRNKLAEMGIYIIKYHTLTLTAQPLGKSKVLVNTFGKAEINNINYNIISNFVLKTTEIVPKIVSQTFEVFI